MSDDRVVAAHDVLLVGGGAAGLRAAIAPAAPPSAETLWLRIG